MKDSTTKLLIEDSVVRHRILILIGAVVYPLWYFPITSVSDTITDSPILRILAFTICLVAFGASYLRQLKARTEDIILIAGFSLVAIDYTIASSDNFDSPHVIGNILTTILVAMAFDTPRKLGIYAFMTIITASVMPFADSETSRFFWLSGIISASGIASLSLAMRSRLHRTLQDNNKELATTKANLDEAMSVARIGSWQLEVATGKVTFSENISSIIDTNLKTQLTMDSYLNLFSRGSNELLKANIDTCVIDQLSIDMEAKRKSAEGLTQWFRITGYYTNIEGKLFVNGILMDITPQKQQEMELIQSSKMVSLGTMAAGIAHEINTPLMVIGTLAEMQQTAWNRGGHPQEWFTQKNQKIIDTVGKIARIVAGLRRFARDGKGDPIQSVSLLRIIQETAVLFEEKLRTMDISFSFGNITENVYVNCRPVQLSQVILNLINNAIDVLEDHENKRIELSCVASGHNVKLLVRDSGPGIPQTMRDRLMEPFFTTKPIGKGTGLGLSISKGMLEAMHGSLSISDSEQTEFVIELGGKIHEESIAS